MQAAVERRPPRPDGFSASAITIYNSLHLKLPCVKTAVLGSGTYELYRDLLVPGGISNLVPGAGVLALIGAPALAQGAGPRPGDRPGRDPRGMFGAGLDRPRSTRRSTPGGASAASAATSTTSRS